MCVVAMCVHYEPHGPTTYYVVYKEQGSAGSTPTEFSYDPPTGCLGLHAYRAPMHRFGILMLFR